MASCQMVIVVLVFCSGVGATFSSHIGACVALFSKEVHALNCMFGIHLSVLFTVCHQQKFGLLCDAHVRYA